MGSQEIADFMVGIGFEVDTSAQAKAQQAAQTTEAKITAATEAAATKRTSSERKASGLRAALMVALGGFIAAEEQKLADKKEAIQKKATDQQDKRDAESTERAKTRRSELLKSTRALSVGMAEAVTGIVASVTASATGLLWATDRAAKSFERLSYLAINARSSAAGISRFAYAASQLGTTAEDAQQSASNFGENLKLPAFEGILKNSGIVTRDAKGNLRDSTELMKDYIDSLKALPQLQREARASAWGISESTVRAAIRPEFSGYLAEQDHVNQIVGADPNAAAAGGAKFEQSMRRLQMGVGAVKTRVETALFELIRPRLDDIAKWVLDHGSEISKVVTQITAGITDLATAFAKSPVVQDAISSMGDNLDRFAKYVASDDFKRDIHNFVDDISRLAKAIRGALEWIGILPTRAQANTLPDPEGTMGDDGPNMNLFRRGMHGRGFGDLSQSETDEARDKLNTFRGGGRTVGNGGSRSWRNNNPGNIEYGPFAKSMGAIGSDGRFAVFPSYEAGRHAQEHLLFESGAYKNLTLAQAIEKWAPGSENNVPAYVAAMGGDPNTRMSDFTTDQRSKLLDAMQRHEGWWPGRTKAVPDQLPADPLSAGISGVDQAITRAKNAARARAPVPAPSEDEARKTSHFGLTPYRNVKARPGVFDPAGSLGSLAGLPAGKPGYLGGADVFGDAPFATLLQPPGVSPLMQQSIDNSRIRGDTSVTHNPVFNIHGGDVRSSLDSARMVADRGVRDLVRNLKVSEA